MGTSNSKAQEQTSNGAVNNNLIIENPVKIHNDEITTILYFILTLMAVKLIFAIFKYFNKHQKRKYLRRGASMANLSKV